MERATVNMFSVWAVTFFLFGLGFGSCSHAAHAADAPLSCEAYLQSHATASTQVGVAHKSAPDGSDIVLFRLRAGSAVIIYAFTTTPSGEAALKEASMTAGPKCEQEGKTWSSFSIQLGDAI